MTTYSTDNDKRSTDRRGAFARRGAFIAAACLGGLCALTVGFVTGEIPGGHSPALPGMCNGRSDADVLVNAHARSPKFILNLATDGFGLPEGVLIFGQGRDRLYADLFCRVWRHIPGQASGGDCGSGLPESVEIIPEGAVIVHAVGLGGLRDGTQVVVRVDARETEEGRFFRLRFRALGGGHDDHEAAVEAGHDDDEDCEGGGWIRYPIEGWAPLEQLNVRQSTD